MDNPWFITIVGGLIVALIQRALSPPAEPCVFDLILALALFGMAQVPIHGLRQTHMFEAWIQEWSEAAFWLFWEAMAIIVVTLVIEKRRS